MKVRKSGIYVYCRWIRTTMRGLEDIQESVMWVLLQAHAGVEIDTYGEHRLHPL